LLALTVRTFALVATTLGLLTAPALAEDGEPDYEPFPKWSAAFGVQGHGTRIGGRSEGGFGPAFELAYGRGRWQYFLEGSLATSALDKWTTSTDTSIDGRLLRGNLGLRWIARQFQVSSSGAIELILLSGLGAQRFNFDDSGDRSRLTRPEILVGFGLQGRSFRKPRLAFRLDVRAVFTPNDRESALVSCSGNCMDETGSSTGFLTGMALAW
jgi:hypothetical protein